MENTPIIFNDWEQVLNHPIGARAQQSIPLKKLMVVLTQRRCNSGWKPGGACDSVLESHGTFESPTTNS